MQVISHISPFPEIASAPSFLRKSWWAERFSWMWEEGGPQCTPGDFKINFSLQTYFLISPLWLCWERPSRRLPFALPGNRRQSQQLEKDPLLLSRRPLCPLDQHFWIRGTRITYIRSLFFKKIADSQVKTTPDQPRLGWTTENLYFQQVLGWFWGTRSTCSRHCGLPDSQGSAFSLCIPTTKARNACFLEEWLLH